MSYFAELDLMGYDALAAELRRQYRHTLTMRGGDRWEAEHRFTYASGRARAMGWGHLVEEARLEVEGAAGSGVDMASQTKEI